MTDEAKPGAEKQPENLVAAINQTMQEGRVTQLAPNRLSHAEHAFQSFVATPEAGTPLDALFDSKYWAHYSVNPNLQMKPGDHVHVHPEDGSYYAHLLVRSAYRGGVNVVELYRKKFEKSAADAGQEYGDYNVKYSGPRLKWCVERKGDKRRLVDTLETQEAALDWLKQHMRVAA